MTYQEQKDLLHQVIQDLMLLYQDISKRTIELCRDPDDTPKKIIFKSLTASGYFQA